MNCAYSGELIRPLEYDPTLVLPPDRLSEYMGELAFLGAWWSSFLSDEQDYSASVLVPGVGSGIIPAALLSERARRVNRGEDFANFPIHIEAFDFDPRAVSIAEKNLKPYMDSAHNLTVDIYRADWHDRSTWDRVNERQYDAVIMNPPYLTADTVGSIRGGYEQTPLSALVDTTGDNLGIGEYAHLLPEVSKVIKPSPGSVILGRFGVGYAMANRIGNMLLEQFVNRRDHSIAHINVKSYQGNMLSKTGDRRSFSTFLVEPVGMVDSNDGNPVNVYWVPEYIDPHIRDRIVPGNDFSVSFSTDASN